MHRQPVLLGGFWLFVAVLAACTGAVGREDLIRPPIDGQRDDAAGERPGDIPLGKSDSSCAPPAVGRYRRLTRDELDRSLHDLLGDTTHAALTLDPDAKVGTFDNTFEDLWVDEGFLTKFVPIAESVAAKAAATPDALIRCDWSEDRGQLCASKLVTSLGGRMWRAPVPPARAESLLQLFRTVSASTADIEQAIADVITAMLLAPEFLYRDETAMYALRDHDAQATSAQFQVATAVAYFITGSTPDESLLSAAREGKLGSRQAVAAQVSRLLSDPNKRAGVLRFFELLLNVDAFDLMQKDTSAFPMFGPALVTEMKDEARNFVRQVLFDNDGTLATLLTSRSTTLTPRLAAVYGVPLSPIQPQELPKNERAGLLTLAGLLARLSPPNQTNPVSRGKFVLETLLCMELKPPPDMMFSLDNVEAPPDATPRERLALHQRPGCIACHALLDPPGLGLEHYDALGRYRERDGNRPVDARGELAGTEDVDGPFDGAIELADRLASSHRVSQCMATQLARYALGRHENESDECRISQLAERFSMNGAGVLDLIVDMSTSDLFLSRRSPEGTSP